MDTKLVKRISKGPNLKDLIDSLGRKRMYLNGPQDMYLVQCVSFTVGGEVWYVLINDLKRPEFEEGEWEFEGRIIKQGHNFCTTWIPCYGGCSVIDRTGWIIPTSKPTGLFHLEASASFAIEDGKTGAIRQFNEKYPATVFLQYVSPNGYYFVRALDTELNIKFMEFLKAQFAGMCTIYPKGLVS